MAGFLDSFRKKVVESIYKEKPDLPKVKDEDINDTIALGVLMLIVAKSDQMFLTIELDKIKDVLSIHAGVPDEKMPYVLATIRQAEKERVDFWRFTRELDKDLPYEHKLPILEILLRVATVDKDLSDDEIYMLHRIAKVFGIYNEDFKVLLEKARKTIPPQSKGIV